MHQPFIDYSTTVYLFILHLFVPINALESLSPPPRRSQFLLNLVQCIHHHPAYNHKKEQEQGQGQGQGQEQDKERSQSQIL
jgi:hypothetical protein